MFTYQRRTQVSYQQKRKRWPHFLEMCKSRQCKGAVTIKENEIISSRSDEHNHPQNEAEIVVSTVSHCFGHILHE